MKYPGVSARELVRDRAASLAWRSAERIGISRRRAASALRRDRLPQRDRALLELMRRDNAAAPPPYRATEHWLQLNQQFDEWFHWEGIGDVEVQEMNQFFSSPPPTDPKLLRYATWMLYRDLAARDELGLLDKISATIDEESGRAFRFEGRLVSWDLLISLDHLYSIHEAKPEILTSPCVVVELGAGWGRLGYALRQANPAATYVVCDLPEVLLVASRYLPRILPGDRFRQYEETRQASELSRETLLAEPGVWFLGAHQLEDIADDAVDCLVSVASFQEMTVDQVDAYFDVIDRKVDGVFYTLQLRSGRTHGLHLGEIGGLADYPFRPAWRAAFLRNPAWSDLYFETAQLTSPATKDSKPRPGVFS
jgi:putative sugar O-methyltransferase